MADRKRKQALVRSNFTALLAEVKGRIQLAQTRVVLAVNAELVRLYWDIGRIIDQRQRREGWGAAVIPRLAKELKNELPELKGFSERNIDRMIAFYRDYSDPSAIVQPSAAQLHPQAISPQLVAKLHPQPISPQPVAKLPVAKKVPQPAAKLEAVSKVPQPVAQLAPIQNAQQPAAQLPDTLLWSVPWAHHVILMEKVKDLPTRRWYMEQPKRAAGRNKNGGGK